MAPKRKAIVADVSRYTPWYKWLSVVQVAWLLSWILFYVDFSLYIASEFFEQEDYFWFSFQIIFYYNFLIFWMWNLVALIIISSIFLLSWLICLFDNSKAIWKAYKMYFFNSIWIPVKTAVFNFWPLSPFLGLNYLYPLCRDIGK